MQVSVEKTSDLERRLSIVVPSEQFEHQVSSRLKETRSRVRLPGFRPGKVPMKEVRRRFGAAAREETASDVMRASFMEAVQREALSPAGSPVLQVVKLDAGVDFEFTATFEVFPPIELADFSSLEVARPTCEITDGDIDDMVQRLREQRREWEEVERGAEEGDLVTVDFEGLLDGESFEGNKGEDAVFEVGSGRMIEDFDQAIRGMAAGDTREFPAGFPDDYHSDELAGKTVDFTATLNSVKEPRLPEVDDEFIRAFGVEDGDMEAFREEVAGNMRRELDGAIRAQVKSRVMDQLIDNHEIQLPQALVRQEIHALKDRMLQRVREADRKSVSLPDELFRERAERQVALGLITREVIHRHELTPDPAKIRERVEELAEPYADKDQVVAWYYQNEEQLAGVEMAVLEDSVVETVLAAARVSLQERSYADIIAGKMLEDSEADVEDASAAELPSDEPAE